MPAKRWFKILGRLAVLGIVGLAGLLGAIRFEHGRSITLPAPTGHFAVGRTTFHWVNPAQTDEFAPTPEAKREVVAWIWYPAAVTASSKEAEYLPKPWRTALASYSGPIMSGLLTRDPAKVRAHSFVDVEVSPEQQAYPVVILRGGLGAPVTDFTTLAEDLASHGYVVAGFDAPYRTIVVVFPDGRVVTRNPESNPENYPTAQAEKLGNRLCAMWTSDSRFVADQLEQLNSSDGSGRFTGRLAITKLGMFGHSLGGATAAEFCHEEARCKAGIDMDGRLFGSVLQEGLQKPFLFMMSDHSGERGDAEGGKILDEIQAAYNSLPGGRGGLLTIRGTNHFSFSDQILLKSQVLMAALRAVGVTGKTGPRRGLQISAAYVSGFFDTYLRGEPDGRWKKLAAEYPEVSAEMK